MNRRHILLSIGIALLLIAVTLQLSSDGSRSGELTLLTVSETGDGAERGGTATVRLEIVPGTGAIFIDSFPLTRLDTQASTRYANQVACDYLDVDCSQYDFRYTIRANTAIVGGPSAGGAIAVLTAAVLDRRPLDTSIAMTGTINSGGVIGPISGVRAKIDGARRAGLTTVLVPLLSGPENETVPNGTAPLATIAPPGIGPFERGAVPALSGDGVAVIAVGTLDEALAIFTHTSPLPALPAPVAPPEYDARMRAISDEICARNAALHDEIKKRKLTYVDTHNFTLRIAATPLDAGYPRASLCFSQDIELSALIAADFSVSERRALAADVRARIVAVENRTASTPMRTVGDVEVSAIVRERIGEARETMRTLDVDEQNKSMTDDLAYANERIRSAESWSALFGMPGAPLHVDDDHLRRACLAKIAEADERLSYVRLYAPSAIESAEEELALAYRSDTEPVLCILHAAKAAARANLIASAIAVDPSRVDALVAEKIAAGERVLAARQADGSFPILAYSYWRYADWLRKDVPYSALTFAEESLELATLDMYFPKERASLRVPGAALTPVVFFCYGAAFAIGLALFLWPNDRPLRKKRRTR